MKNKKSTLLLATAAAIIGSTVFGTVIGLASKVKYRGVNPTQGVISQLGLIDSVAFKPSIANFTSDYQSVKKALLNGKTFDPKSSEFTDFVSKFDFLTNNGRTVLEIPKKYQVVISEFSPEDDKERFRLGFHLKEKLEDGNIAQSATKFIYLLPLDMPKAALGQYSYIVDKNFNNLIIHPLSNFSAQSIKPLALTRSSDFIAKLNQFKNQDELWVYLEKFFDLEALKANIRLQTADFSFEKGNLVDPFVYSFIRNPQNEKEWASDLNQDQKTVRLYLRTEFSPQAKTILKDYKYKDETFLSSIDLKASNGTSLFANEDDLKDQLDVDLLDVSDYFGGQSETITSNSQVKPVPASERSLKDRVKFKKDQQKPRIEKFSLYEYDALSFYSQLQELVSKPNSIKDLVNATLARNLRFSLGKYNFLFDDLASHLDYTFLVSKAKIKQSSITKKLFIELPIKISLKSSILGDQEPNIKTLFEKEVTFKLDNFRDVEIEKAFGLLYPGVNEELEQARRDQRASLEKEKAKKGLKEFSQQKDENSKAINNQDSLEEDDNITERLPENSPIQYQQEKAGLGSSPDKPYMIKDVQNQRYYLAKSQIQELIKAKDYTKLAKLLSNRHTYNISLRLKEQLFDVNPRIPSSRDIENAKFVLDKSEKNKYWQIYSSASPVFQNKWSLFGYYRYLLGLDPKQTIHELVKLGQKAGLQFEGYQNLPSDFNLEDLKNIRIKTPLFSQKDNFKLSLLDFNNYYDGEIKAPEFGLPLFLPKELRRNSSNSGGSQNSNSLWEQEIISQFKDQNLSNQDQLAQFSTKIWEKIIGDENEFDQNNRLQYKLLKDLQESWINKTRDNLYWTYLGDKLKVKPKNNLDAKFRQISNLQELLTAFYTSAALSNNWNYYQDSGAKSTIIFEEIAELDPKVKEKVGADVYQLKFHYAIGFDDNAGKFNQEVIRSSSRTIYLKTSGKSKLEADAIDQLNQAIENAPLGLQSFYLDTERFGVFQKLATSLAVQHKQKEKPLPKKLNNDGYTLIHDKLKKPVIPQISSSPEKDWFEGKLNQNGQSQNVNVSTFGSIIESPYFSTNFQEESDLDQEGQDDSKQGNKSLDNQEAGLLKQKLAILLGNQFIQYYQQSDKEIEFEIINVEKVSELSFRVEFKLAKTLEDNGKTIRVLSDETMSLIVNTTIEKAPEMSAAPEVFDTKWVEQYDPRTPLAAKTKFVLKFKDQIPVDASGNISDKWLASIPLVIHQQMLRLSPVVKTIRELGLKTEQQQQQQQKKAVRKEEELETYNPKDEFNILNPLTKAHRLTLSNLVNNDPNYKIEDLKVIKNEAGDHQLEFSLRANNIKRLMNTPITFADYNPFFYFNEDWRNIDKYLNNKGNVSSQQQQQPGGGNQGSGLIQRLNKNIKPETFTPALIALKRDNNTNLSNYSDKIIMIKPKYLVERSIGVPWSTGRDGYIGFGSEQLKGGTSSNGQNEFKQDFIEALGLENTEYHGKLGLSIRIFDPGNELAKIKDASNKKGEEKLLKSYDLFKNYLNEYEKKSPKIAKGWTNIHPDQKEYPNPNQKLPENYLNLVLNQPWKVTLYNSSDFITNLFVEPEGSDRGSGAKLKQVIQKQVNNNYADWGSAYLTFWYDKNIITNQPNVITANIADVFIKDVKELEDNTKLIAPNITQWWPNISGSKEKFYEPTVFFGNWENENSNGNSQAQTPTWEKIREGFALQALKSSFDQKTRTFVLTTNAPLPLWKYGPIGFQNGPDFKTQDWRLVFQNDDNQIAALRVQEQDRPEKSSEDKDKQKWIKFKVVIPEEMFNSGNIRFVGVMQVQGPDTLWLPVINSSVIYDFYRGTGDSNDVANLNVAPWQVKTIAFTNNAFNNVFKEFNISKKIVE